MLLEVYYSSAASTAQLKDDLELAIANIPDIEISLFEGKVLVHKCI